MLPLYPVFAYDVLTCSTTRWQNRNGQHIGLSLELPAFGLVKQVHRVFRNPGLFLKNPQKPLALSGSLVVADDLIKTPARGQVESFFVCFVRTKPRPRHIHTNYSNMLDKQDSG